MVVPLSNEILCTGVHGGAQRCVEACRGAQMGVQEGLMKVYKGTQGAQRYAGCTEVHTRMCRGTWRCTGGAHRWTKVHSGVLKCMEECIGLQRGTQRCVEVYRGCRGVCRGTQRGV